MPEATAEVPALEEWEPWVGALDVLSEKGQSIEVALKERKEEEQHRLSRS